MYVYESPKATNAGIVLYLHMIISQTTIYQGLIYKLNSILLWYPPRYPLSKGGYHISMWAGEALLHILYTHTGWAWEFCPLAFITRFSLKTRMKKEKGANG